MAITARVKSQYFQKDKGLIRLAPSQDHLIPTKRAGTPWTPHEHNLFLEALERYPSGPWKTIAAYIGTRTTRQTMTHAQKYREKIARRQKAKGAASPTNEEKSFEVVSTKACTDCEPPSNEPVQSSSAQVLDIKQAEKEEEAMNNLFVHPEKTENYLL